jgi:hypothetical protein
MKVEHHMLKKMARALRQADDMYDLGDIEIGLKTGNMQGHVEGNTWAITQVHDYPKKRTVNILFVIGELEDSVKLEAKIEEWAKSVDADLITAIGRDGWWEHRVPGWRKLGTLYAKDI